MIGNPRTFQVGEDVKSARINEAGRQIEGNGTIHFTSISANSGKIAYIRERTGQTPEKASIKIDEEPSVDFYDAIAAFAPIAVQVTEIPLDRIIEVISVNVKLNHDARSGKWYEDLSLHIARLSHSAGDNLMPIIETIGPLQVDLWPLDAESTLEKLYDEAFLYAFGSKRAQQELPLNAQVKKLELA
jgi:hypothetical protein